MRLAIVAPSVRGAMGQYLGELSRALSEKLELHLFVPAHYEYEAGRSYVHRFDIGNSRVQRLFNFLNLIRGERIWRSIEEVQPDIVHLFNGEGYPWSIMYAWRANRNRLPLVVTIHDPEPHPGNIWDFLNAQLRRVTLKFPLAVHIHAERFKTFFSKKGIDDESIYVIPHGSIASRFVKFRKTGIKRERLALFFGRLEFYKGIDLLVQAGIRLKGDVRVAIAGPGKLPRSVLKVVKRYPDIFELHNRYLDEEEVAHLFQRASVCVLPYRQASQSSLPLIAAAFGVSVVATAVGGFVEDVPRVNGLLVSPNDPIELAEGIRLALGLKPVFPRSLEFGCLVDQFTLMYKDILSKAIR